MKKKNFLKNNLVYIIIGLILTIYVCSLVGALIWAFFSTLRPYSDFLNNPAGMPTQIFFDNWIQAFQQLAIPVYKNGVYKATYYIEHMLLFSLIYSLGCAFIQTATACVCAYLSAKYPFRLGKIVYATVIVVMIIPIVGSLPSEIQMLTNLGLYDSFIGIFVMKMNFLGLYYLVFYGTFKSLSWEYAESAFLDGANHFVVMMRIMLPLVQTTFITVLVLNFIGYWNDYTTIMIYLPSYPTMSYGLFYMKFIATASFGKVPMQLTGCILMALPILILFIIFQDRLMGNLTVGGLKG